MVKRATLRPSLLTLALWLAGSGMAAATEVIAIDVYWLVHAAPQERQGQWLRQRGSDPGVTATVPQGRSLWFSGPCFGGSPCALKSRMALVAGQMPLRQGVVSVTGRSGKARGLKAQDLMASTPRFERDALSRRLRPAGL